MKTELLNTIAEAAGCSPPTVYTVRRLYNSGGLDAALAFKGPRVTNADIEKRILALSRKAPPAGRPRWTIGLLAEEAVKQGIAEHMKTMTVSRILRTDAARRGDLSWGRRQETYVQKITPVIEKRILALSRKAPPAGHIRWSGALLAAAVMEAGIVSNVSAATVRTILRKAAGPDYKAPPTRRPSAYPVVLSDTERASLETLLKESSTPRRVRTCAQVLLLLSQHTAGLPATISIYTDTEAARLCNCAKLTVHNIRRRFCEGGLAFALNLEPAPQPPLPGINVPRAPRTLTVDDLSADYLMAKAAHKTPAEIIGEMVQEQLAASIG